MPGARSGRTNADGDLLLDRFTTGDDGDGVDDTGRTVVEQFGR